MDKFGVVGLPVYLTIVLVVSSAVFGYLVLSVFFLEAQIDSKMVAGEVDIVVSEAESMYEHADQGTKSCVHVDIPEGVSFIVFGGMPENGNNLPSNLQINSDTCNNYYFVMDDGECRSFSSAVKFCGETTGVISVLYPGEYDVCLDLVKTGSGSYVKVYSE